MDLSKSRRHFRPLRPSRPVTGAIITCLLVACAARVQGQSPRAKIEALGLDSMTLGRVTTLFAPGDRARARQLADRSQAATAFFERELGVSFDLRLAVLGPEDWLSPHGAGLPYGIPWSSVAERLLVVPASLTEGALIKGPNTLEDRRRVDFVTLHEVGHLTAKQYLHPTSAHEELPILWFEELVATYFAYAFVISFDRDWVESARKDWSGRVKDYTPRKRSLDWSFMRTLPPAEVALTYGWYQYVLNLRVADIYAQYGISFLRALKDRLPFLTMDTWTTKFLLEHLEHIAPGFRLWADEFQESAAHPGDEGEAAVYRNRSYPRKVGPHPNRGRCLTRACSRQARPARTPPGRHFPMGR